MADLIVRGGTVVTPTGTEPRDVLVADGRVAALLPAGAAAEAAATLDATGCLVLPGAIDAHVHFRTPGLTHKEDWPSGSAAAVAGGVTTVLDMPNVVPPTATAEALTAKARLVEGRSRCHYGFYGALAADNAAALEGLVSAGAIGFKVFLGETTASLPPPDDGALLAAFGRLGALGRRTMVHAENGAILRAAADALARGAPAGRGADQAPGPWDLTRHGRSRPAVAETEAVARVCLLAAVAGAPIAIAHLSTAGGCEAVRRAKGDGIDVRGETCPHHLLLTEAEAAAGGLGALAKVNPPLRAADDRQALWAAVADGTIDEIGSDHAPHSAEERAGPQPPSGFAGVQNTLPHLLGDARLPLRRLVELVAEGPARAWGLWPGKGRVAVGADADLAIVRPAPPSRPARQWSLHPDGPVTRLRAARAEVLGTVVGGHVAFWDGALVGDCRGRWVRP